MGEIVTIKVLTSLMRAHELPEGANFKWNPEDPEQVSQAERIFEDYLKEGWLAFSEEERGKRQIFKFDPHLERIVLMPPIGGG